MGTSNIGGAGNIVDSNVHVRLTYRHRVVGGVHQVASLVYRQYYG